MADSVLYAPPSNSRPAAPPPIQTYSNHARVDHIFLAAILILVTNFVVVTVTAIRYDLSHFAWMTILWVAVAFATIVIGMKARTNPLKVQDRVIRLEERLRYAGILPAPLAARAESLTIRQVVALRFASDAELPTLIDRTLTESLTPKQIKQSITTWRPRPPPRLSGHDEEHTMRTAFPAAALIILTMTISAHSPADQTIHALIDAQTEAWNRNDATAWAKDFTGDASFINIRGDMVKGRAAVEKLHTQIFAGPYKQSHAAVTIQSIAYPAPTVAVVETTHDVTNFKGLPPGIAETAPGVLRTRMKYILVDDKGAWKIFAAQNTVIVPQPTAPH